jgi:ASC-1-like (ASCH) protein
MLPSHLELYASAISIREFREYRRMRNAEPLSSVMSRGTDEEEMVQRFPPQPENTYQGYQGQQYAAPPRYHTQVVRGKQ